MKIIMNGFACALVLLFISACGKDNSTGSKSTGFNPYVSPSLQNGTQALASLQQWVSQPESSMITIGAYKTEISSTSGFSFSGSLCFNNCLQTQYPSCFVRNTSNNTFAIGTTTSNNCNATTAAPAKSSNATLMNAINGEGGALELFQISTSGPVYELSYREKNSFMSQPTVVHVIDTTLPSFLNPISTYDARTGKQSTLRVIRLL
jgi:hypothetical protein